MAKITLQDITGSYASVAKLNANFTAIEDALENTLSRDGTAPNTMAADLDLNSNRILNLPDPTLNQEPVTLGYLDSNYGSGAVGSAADAAASAASAAASATSANTSAVNSFNYATNAQDSATAAAASAAIAETNPAKLSRAGDTLTGEILNTATSAFQVAAGTTAERPTGAVGKIRWNSTLNQYEGYTNSGTWEAIGGGAKGAPGNGILFENDITVTGDYTITTGKNAMSAGPLTIADGVTVTVPNGSVWSIV